MAEQLAVWLYGRQVAVVDKERNHRLRLSYTEDALSAFEGGTPLLSLALPLTRDRYPNGVTRAFLDGLLPEGDPRNAIAADLDLLASDVFGLIGALGKDCAGALVVQPQDEPPPTVPTTQDAEALSDDDLAQLVANLRNAPLASTATSVSRWPASRKAAPHADARREMGTPSRRRTKHPHPQAGDRNLRQYRRERGLLHARRKASAAERRQCRDHPRR